MLVGARRGDRGALRGQAQEGPQEPRRCARGRARRSSLNADWRRPPHLFGVQVTALSEHVHWARLKITITFLLGKLATNFSLVGHGHSLIVQ